MGPADSRVGCRTDHQVRKAFMSRQVTTKNLAPLPGCGRQARIEIYGAQLRYNVRKRAVRRKKAERLATAKKRKRKRQNNFAFGLDLSANEQLTVASFLHRKQLTMDGIERAGRTQHLRLQFFCGWHSRHYNISAAHRGRGYSFFRSRHGCLYSGSLIDHKRLVFLRVTSHGTP